MCSSDLRHSLPSLAKEVGFEVIEAKDGNECLTQARTQQPKVVLLDLNMPDPGGLAVMEILSQELPDLRVVVVTADIQETTRARCLELGAIGFLNKPVDPQALIQALQALL